jgi:hypothetical protein
MDVHEMLAALQQQQEELERLAEQQQASAARFDADEQMRVAEAIEDPVERTRAVQDVLRLQSAIVSSQATNLAMRRIIELERSVISLAERVRRVEQALGDR